MTARLLVVWIASLGATRIDLLAGQGPLVLTPFLVLSPLLALIAAEAAYANPRGRPRHPDAGGFVLAVTGLVILLTTSAFLAYDLATSARRLALLIAQLFLVTVGSALLLERADRADLLVRGARWGILGIAAADLVQLIVYLVQPAWLTDGVLNFSPGLYFGVIPRLTGLGTDPNLGGLTTVVFTWLAWRFGPPGASTRRLVRLGTLCVILTLSRSAALAGAVLLAGTALRGRALRVTPGNAGAAALAVLMLLLPYLTSPSGADALDSLGRMLGTRFTLDEGSTSQHGQLLIRGLEVATSDLKHLLVGMGYGNAYLETQDFFPGNDYGNFHSLFVTLLAESGIFASVWGMAIFVQAFRLGPTFRPLIVAMVVFNLFQQSHTEPVMWLILCLAWVAGAHELVSSGDTPAAAVAAGPAAAFSSS
jgi:hypothetical protein